VIDIAGHEARPAGRRIALMHQEFELLRFRGRVFTRETLLERAWGDREVGGTRTVDIHVRRIRCKLGERDRLSRQYATLAARCEAKVQATV
jgi:DNA-binding response OmpR family regulator